jgi:hypothetical protein
VLTGTSTTGAAIELAVNDAMGIKRGEIVRAREQLTRKILEDRSTLFV